VKNKFTQPPVAMHMEAIAYLGSYVPLLTSLVFVTVETTAASYRVSRTTTSGNQLKGWKRLTEV
jgi:hypothetical protein